MSASPAGSRAGIAAAVALALLQATLLVRTAADKSDTADEPYYLTTAAHQWRSGDFGACDAPALPKWGFGAALRVSDPRIFDADARIGRHPLWSRPMAIGRRNLLAARLATIAVTLCAGLLLWACAGRFGATAALVAHALWSLSPTVLAQGSLATLDAWVTSFAVLGLWTAVRLVERPTAGRAAALGAALALAAACKVTALGLLPAAAVVSGAAVVRAARASGRPIGGALARTAGVGAAAFLLALSAVYLFGWGDVDTGRLCGKVAGATGRRFGPLPFAPWIEGLMLQVQHGSKGHLSYLFGHATSEGWWWFYLACLALKTTVGAQALALVAVAVRLKARERPFWVDAAVLAFPALLLVVLSLGKAQNGVRYLLPAFPFAMLWAGWALARAHERLGRAGAVAVSAALLAGSVESLTVHPHHLMFFNVWAGGPEGGPRYLVHGDDWGQDQRRLAAWQAEHRPWRLYYTYYSGDPHYWGVSFEPVACEPRPGFYALHAVEVHRPKRLPAGCLDWLTVEPPDQRIGYSLYLYQVNKDRIERLGRERGTQDPFWRSGREPGSAAPGGGAS
ncbi:MAG: glycosyltransferase family 39 protein [Acidobacteria bacterium]|nr:glycosyltransferase family 39 protein [Acidobacteriota bacterium]